MVSLIEFEEEKTENVEEKGYNEDDVNNLIDMMASKDEAQLKEQNQEFELLQQKLKKNNKIGKQQQNQSLDADDCLLGNDGDLFKNTDDEFEREWQSVFNTQTSTNNNNFLPQSQTNDNSEDLLLSPSSDSSFFKLLSNTNDQQSILKPQNLVAPKPQQQKVKNF